MRFNALTQISDINITNGGKKYQKYLWTTQARTYQTTTKWKWRSPNDLLKNGEHHLKHDPKSWTIWAAKSWTNKEFQIKSSGLSWKLQGKWVMQQFENNWRDKGSQSVEVQSDNSSDGSSDANA